MADSRIFDAAFVESLPDDPVLAIQEVGRRFLVAAGPYLNTLVYDDQLEDGIVEAYAFYRAFINRVDVRRYDILVPGRCELTATRRDDIRTMIKEIERVVVRSEELQAEADLADANDRFDAAEELYAAQLDNDLHIQFSEDDLVHCHG